MHEIIKLLTGILNELQGQRASDTELKPGDQMVRSLTDDSVQRANRINAVKVLAKLREDSKSFPTVLGVSQSEIDLIAGLIDPTGELLEEFNYAPFVYRRSLTAEDKIVISDEELRPYKVPKN